MIRKPNELTWLSDAEYASLPRYQRALHLAACDVGKQEDAAHTNGGPYVLRLLSYLGIKFKAPWCASFVYSKFVDAGVDKGRLPKNGASTEAWYQWALKNGRLRDSKKFQPRRYDLFVETNGREGHMGFITDSLSKALRDFRTIEGNTNDDGSRDGYAVCRRTRDCDWLESHKHYGIIDMEGI